MDVSKSVKHGALNPAPASGSPRAWISGGEEAVPVPVPVLAPRGGQHVPVRELSPAQLSAGCPWSCQLGVCWGLAVRAKLLLGGDGWEGVFRFELVMRTDVFSFS